MKFNKLFFAALSFAALAMIGCKSKNEPTPTPTPTPSDSTEVEAPELITLDAPEAGKTTIVIYADVCPKGAYLVGNFNDYNVGDDETASFEPVDGEENWYAVTIDYREDLQAKAIARPSDDDVALGWSFQWGKNYDPEDPGDVEEGTENTVILGGEGAFVYENNGQPKISEVADGGVVYIWVKEWATSPVIEAKKLETCWAKTNWYGGNDWTWKEMAAKGDGKFELATLWGGSGLNIAETEGGADQWYPTDKIEFIDAPHAGDSVLVTFVSEKGAIGKLSIKLLEAGEPAEPLDYVEGFLYVLNEGTLTDINIYGWATNKDNNNEIFGEWPGERINGDATSLTRVFFEKAVKDGEYKFIINGTGGQTADPEWVVTIADETTHPYLKVTADNELIVIEEN